MSPDTVYSNGADRSRRRDNSAMASKRRARTTTAGPDRVPGMYWAPEHQVDDTAVGVVSRIFTNEIRWIFNPSEKREYGIDGHAHAVRPDGLISGRMLAVQIKGGKSWFARPAADGSGWPFWSDSDHLHYWLGYHVPVLVVFVRPDDGAAFWEVVRTSTVTEHAKGFTLVVPSSQRLDASAAGKLMEVAVNERGLIESFPTRCEVLPPSVGRILERAWEADPLAAARLADKLAAGRAGPDLAVRALWKMPPPWLAKSPGAQDLWLAAGRYAQEHGCLDTAGGAFALAATTPGARQARAHAVAGVVFLACDRPRARGHLEQARAGGEDLLADVGLADLAVPDGDRRPPEVPASVQAATPDQLAAEPIVLGFLAVREMMQGEYLRSLQYREREWAAVPETDTVARLALADAIRRQALTDSDSAARELQRAMGHAMAAVRERRRWDGPSDVALAVALDILILTNDWAGMLDIALPADRGGRALPREAASPMVARRAAVAADAQGDGSALEFFLQALPDNGHRRRLQRQVSSSDPAAPAGVQAEAWLQLLEDSRDDESAVLCLVALARLGIWPARADELLAQASPSGLGIDLAGGAPGALR